MKQLLPKHTLDVKLFLVSSLRLPSRYDSRFILVRGGNLSSSSTTTPIGVVLLLLQVHDRSIRLSRCCAAIESGNSEGACYISKLVSDLWV